eukprot:Lithocolla_globosa_v1_NODE_7483_length_941_cov_19.450339.p1 type:complete len:188 gc:universal NODE_7483_length_941_cov_19.450339:800-237(-)
MKLVSDKNKFGEYFDRSSKEWVKSSNIDSRKIKAYHYKVTKSVMKAYAKKHEWKDQFTFQIVGGCRSGETSFQLPLERRMWNTTLRASGDKKPRSPARIFTCASFISVMKECFDVTIKKMYIINENGDWGALQPDDPAVLNYVHGKPKLLYFTKRNGIYAPNYAKDFCQGYLSVKLLLRSGGPGTFV